MKESPAEQTVRTHAEDLARKLASRREVVEALDHVRDAVVVLNQDRRIVFCNTAFREAMGGGAAETYWGRPLGHVVGCQHAEASVDTCGTTDCCMVCGALKAMLLAGRGQYAQEECRITRGDGQPLEFLVAGEPYEVDGQQMMFLTLNDISDRKRRRLLERIFFHDLINTAGGIHTMTELMQDADESEWTEYRDLLRGMSGDLLHNIRSQQILSAAEAGELESKEGVIFLESLVEEVRALLRRQDLLRGRTVTVRGLAQLPAVAGDKRLLGLVVEQMLRNGLEASDSGEVVTVTGAAEPEGSETPDTLVLTVQNPAVMPRHVQLQVFNRFFSTKGESRGMGTYTMKLLGERYLGGEVGFESDAAMGTTFFIRLPVA